MPTTRWQGTRRGSGFFAQACATARAAFGWPMFLARAEYVQVEPLGMPLIQSQHFFGKQIR